jgi:hypothetical protein
MLAARRKPACSQKLSVDFVAATSFGVSSDSRSVGKFQNGASGPCDLVRHDLEGARDHARCLHRCALRPG